MHGITKSSFYAGKKQKWDEAIGNWIRMLFKMLFKFAKPAFFLG